MSEMTENSEILLASLAESLDSTAKLTQALLSDLREGEADFAAMKTEINILKEHVHGLSELVKDGGTSSILTKVALIEQSLVHIKVWMDNHVDVHQRLNKDFSLLRTRIVEIEKRLNQIEQALVAAQTTKPKKETSKIKIVMIAILAFASLGIVYLANSCSSTYGATGTSTSIIV